MVKLFFKYLLFGVLWGWGFFIAICVVLDLSGIGIPSVTLDNFSLNVLASTIVGIGFGTSSIVYKVERLHLWQQSLIHFGIGMPIYLIVGFSMGWFPAMPSYAVIVTVLLAVMVFAIIWSCFYLYYRSVAKKINEQLKTKMLDD